MSARAIAYDGLIALVSGMLVLSALGLLASCETERPASEAPEIHRGENGTPTRLHDRRPDYMR